MTRNSMSPGQKPSYVQHGMTVNTLISLKRPMQMPFKDPGELNGLGGEFVLGPGLECTFAHRMKTTRDHAELPDILKAIGTMIPRTLAEQLANGAAGLAKKNKKEVEQPKRKLSAKGDEGRLVIRVVDNPRLRDEAA